MNKNKFNKGDEVRIKYFKDYPSHWTNEMRNMSGKLVTINKIKRHVDLPYKINDCMWGWLETDFNEIVDFKLMNDKLFRI